MLLNIIATTISLLRECIGSAGGAATSFTDANESRWNDTTSSFCLQSGVEPQFCLLRIGLDYSGANADLSGVVGLNLSRRFSLWNANFQSDLIFHRREVSPSRKRDFDWITFLSGPNRIFLSYEYQNNLIHSWNIFSMWTYYAGLLQIFLTTW